MFTRFFIDRPIFAAVLSIIVTLAGSVAVVNLPVAQYPEITPPTVEVSAIYPGANARVVADTVAAPLEQQVNGVEDMMYMASTCANDGSYTLTVTFKPGTDLNIAQVLVQNRVALGSPVLPDIVKRRGVTVKKKSPSVLMIVNLFSPDGSRDNLYLSNYATIQLRDEIARVPGVGDISFLGQRDYSMRLWLDPDKMAARNLSAADVVHAVEQQNAQVAAGQIGQPPAPTGQAFQYTINTLGRLSDEAQFSDMIIKADAGGRLVRLHDVARIELGAIGYDQTCTLDGRPSVAMSVYQLPGSNAIETARQARAKMDELKARFPKGLDYAIAYDTTPFIDESISEVFKTLRDAVALVALVMLVFLQSWRSALIPLAAVPVAIVGTFAVMAAVGFSLNNLTLFGLVLAVGIVVDDAIVVVEAVEHHIENGMSPHEATVRAMDEVSGPVIAVGLVLTAVFVPCVFISGIVGQFFRQFAVTIAISTLISAFNSLTLSPALCALLLKPRTAERRDPLPRVSFALAGAVIGALYLTPLLGHGISVSLPAGFERLQPLVSWLPAVAAAAAGAVAGWAAGAWLNRGLGWLFGGFNAGFASATTGYLKAVRVFLRTGPVVLAGYAVLLGLTYFLFQRVPTGFIPAQDKGYLLVNVQLPDSASLTRTDEVMRRVEDAARRIPGVKHTLTVSGQSILLGVNAPNFGTAYVMLDDFNTRRSPELTADGVAAALRAAFAAEIPAAVVNVFGAPPVDGLGTAGGFKMVIEAPGDGAAKPLQEAGERVVGAAGESPQLEGVYTGFRADTPWLYLQIDRVAAQSRGVNIAEVINALQVYFGSLYINDFNRFGRTWQVNVQADGAFRRKASDLKRLQVRNDQNEMVQVGSFLTLVETTGPVMVQRYNLYPALSINGAPAAGVSSGDALASMEAAARDALPATMRSEWTELALLQLQTQDTAMRAFLLAVVLVFLVLAAQYESWSLPLAVILVVPMCLLGAGVGVWFAGMDVNIFTQVGFIVLVGLACKNAILIVEFGRTRYMAGAGRREAILEACALRLRPIVMTSVAFILGVVPLVVAEGAGAEMRRTLGTAVFAGMIGVTVFGIFLTPVFFDAILWAAERLRSGMGRPSAGEDLR